MSKFLGGLNFFHLHFHFILIIRQLLFIITQIYYISIINKEINNCINFFINLFLKYLKL